MHFSLLGTRVEGALALLALLIASALLEVSKAVPAAFVDNTVLKSWEPFLDVPSNEALVQPSPESTIHLRDILLGSIEEKRSGPEMKRRLKPILLPKLRRATSSFACSWDCERGGWGGGYGK
ncbi:hypothetical protein CAPTEDRAFT_227789 [Capitella teleta]|uniref:Uncharacterized protein n=1 Tax=Capitella teleta TaxID=283909 RepID=R7VK12_CAPTE|nr:hypothetical protein CAPTEDRAFT_227789 [Capitella teleta]|eukprot:ELU16380.1 hypothetical protein CAPTEDRAFT_227789 [Capitella teleta]